MNAVVPIKKPRKKNDKIHPSGIYHSCNILLDVVVELII